MVHNRYAPMRNLVQCHRGRRNAQPVRRRHRTHIIPGERACPVTNKGDGRNGDLTQIEERFQRLGMVDTKRLDLASSDHPSHVLGNVLFKHLLLIGCQWPHSQSLVKLTSDNHA